MKVHLFCLCLLTSAFSLPVQSKPHGKHEPHHKQTHPPRETDSPVLDAEDDAILPTLFPFEASSSEPEDADVNEKTSGTSEQLHMGALEASDGDEESIPVLLSEEALTKLLQASEEDPQAMEDEKEDEGEESEVEEVREESMDVKEESKTEDGGEARNEEQQKQQAEVEELGSSIDSEIPMNLDYVADSEAIDPLPSELEEAKPLVIKAEDVEEAEDELPTAMEDYDSQQSPADAEETREGGQADQPVPVEGIPNEQEEALQISESNQDDADDVKEKEGIDDQLQDSVEPEDNNLLNEKEDTSESGSIATDKDRNEKKTQRLRKMQSDQPSVTEEQKDHAQDQEKEPESNQPKSKRKKNGKWAPQVGMNPVHIRAMVELFPRTRPVVRTRLGADGQEAPPDACENFRCKRGKTCKLNEEKMPTCVCQEPADCPSSVAEFEHVCGTDNQTYDTSCQLFATKCGLEGTKKGHRLHLDYTGSCKFIPPCLNTELVQFPLRMRDWLKNVLLQLYEHDSMTPGFLTAKQRARVQKMYESERRLRAGDHPIELLAQDFEKNYHMYIYPVHWQFAQMDQHPSDRFLSHSELAPLRVPLVPMEHCTSVFFQECDADKDKLVSFREWCQCFGIKDEDMDTNLLF